MTPVFLLNIQELRHHYERAVAECREERESMREYCMRAIG
jgi:hypothetical protein